MSDTPLPPNPFEGDPDDGSGASGAGGPSDAFFGGFDDSFDEGFEPAIDASMLGAGFGDDLAGDFEAADGLTDAATEGATFADGADAYFADAVAEAEPEMEPDAPEASGDGAATEALVAAPTSVRRRSRGRGGIRTGKTRGTQQVVLGVHVTPTHVYGVLLRDSGEGRYEALHTLARARSQGSEDTSGAMTPSDVGTADLSGDFDDGSVQFGSGQELDFTGEFDGIVSGADVGVDMGAIGAPRVAAQPIVFELKDMLEEVAQVGFDRPALAFSMAPPDVEYVEVLVPEDKKSRKAKAKKGKEKDKAVEVAATAVKRDKLVSLLPPSQAGREVDTERVAFLPMTAREGRPRFLAIIPQPTDPVVPALSMLREQSKHRRTAFKTIEAEAALLVGMTEMCCPAEPNENTAVVRVGAEDTLVLLLSGGKLHHMEPMQSVTAYDGPDTICSRVLLQQDVQGVGTVHNVIVLADEREEDLVQGFAAFYPDARVSTMGELLADMGISTASPEAGGEPVALTSERVEAAGAALAAMAGKNGPFEDANLMPKALRKKKRRLDLSFGWHTLVVAVLLFLSVVFFIGLYLSQNGEIAERERTLAEYPPEATMAVPQLQMRIDSLRQAQAEITTALAAMDSLLYGTDRWTQDLTRTSRAVSETGGAWFDEWQPGANSLSLHGYATSRARVVSLAQRLGATIEESIFSEVREYPVYEFRLLVPSQIELPQTAKYLREQLGEPIPPPRDGLGALDAAAPGINDPALAPGAASGAAPPEAAEPVGVNG